ncbi:MAG: hypothetical protein IT392_00165 [Nitrospirae bacterium]|nr:hypothetical protein [Nitrospirota bacterium]
MEKIVKLTISSLVCVLLIISAASYVNAAGNDIKLNSGLLESEFKDLSKQAGLMISYIPLAPAEPLGILGFDVGVEMTATKIDSGSSVWKKAVSDGNPPDYILLPRIHAQKGLPFGIDVGAVFAALPGSNIKLYGGELKWAVLKGSIISPAVAIRGSYTTLAGVDDIDVSTYGLDASVSKGFGPITPYGGIGQVWVHASESVNFLDFDSVSTSATKLFVGTRLSLLFLSFAIQADFSDVNMYSARASISF